MWVVLKTLLVTTLTREHDIFGLTFRTSLARSAWQCKGPLNHGVIRRISLGRD